MTTVLFDYSSNSSPEKVLPRCYDISSARVLVIGDSNIGKSELISKLVPPSKSGLHYAGKSNKANAVSMGGSLSSNRIDAAHTMGYRSEYNYDYEEEYYGNNNNRNNNYDYIDNEYHDPNREMKVESEDIVHKTVDYNSLVMSRNFKEYKELLRNAENKFSMKCVYDNYNDNNDEDGSGGFHSNNRSDTGLNTGDDLDYLGNSERRESHDTIGGKSDASDNTHDHSHHGHSHNKDKDKSFFQFFEKYPNIEEKDYNRLKFNSDLTIDIQVVEVQNENFQSYFSELKKLQVKQADVFLLCFDSTDLNSLENLKTSYTQIVENLNLQDQNYEYSIYVVCTKRDIFYYSDTFKHSIKDFLHYFSINYKRNYFNVDLNKDSNNKNRSEGSSFSDTTSVSSGSSPASTEMKNYVASNYYGSGKDHPQDLDQEEYNKPKNFNSKNKKNHSKKINENTINEVMSPEEMLYSVLKNLATWKCLCRNGPSALPSLRDSRYSSETTMVSSVRTVNNSTIGLTTNSSLASFPQSLAQSHSFYGDSRRSLDPNLRASRIPESSSPLTFSTTGSNYLHHNNTYNEYNGNTVAYTPDNAVPTSFASKTTTSTNSLPQQYQHGHNSSVSSNSGVISPLSSSSKSGLKSIFEVSDDVKKSAYSSSQLEKAEYRATFSTDSIESPRFTKASNNTMSIINISEEDHLDEEKHHQQQQQQHERAGHVTQLGNGFSASTSHHNSPSPPFVVSNGEKYFLTAKTDSRDALSAIANERSRSNISFVQTSTPPPSFSILSPSNVLESEPEKMDTKSELSSKIDDYEQVEKNEDEEGKTEKQVLNNVSNEKKENHLDNSPNSAPTPLETQQKPLRPKRASRLVSTTNFDRSKDPKSTKPQQTSKKGVCCIIM